MKNNQACLYLVGMPLGNLKDISIRAKEVLSTVDKVACEDTRTTSLLLKDLDLVTGPLISYHEHNQVKRTEELLAFLKKGHTLALVSDAGMPAISDPGQILVDAVSRAGILVSVIPGPTAAMTVLAASGLDSRRFVFEGFLEVKGKERKMALERIQKEERTIVLYEAPHRIKKTLQDLIEIGLAKRLIVAGRELTKRYEEYLRMSVEELYAYYEDTNPRGEYSLVIEGLGAAKERLPELDTSLVPSRESLLRLMHDTLEQGATKRDLVKVLTEEYGLKKNEAYEIVHESLPVDEI